MLLPVPGCPCRLLRPHPGSALRPPASPSRHHTLPSRLRRRPVSPAPGSRLSPSAVLGPGGRPYFSCSFFGPLLLLGFISDSQVPEQLSVAVFSKSFASDSVCLLPWRPRDGGQASCWVGVEHSVSTAWRRWRVCSLVSAFQRAGVQRLSERSGSAGSCCGFRDRGWARLVPACPPAPFLCRWCRHTAHSLTLLLDLAQEHRPAGGSWLRSAHTHAYRTAVWAPRQRAQGRHCPGT